MDCIYCNGKTRVAHTYTLRNKDRRRQRVCKECNQSFNTTETADEEEKA